MVRQKDIAERLGLSRSLVTKVLNGNLGTTQVRPETARAILELSEQLGYRPDPTAHSLVTGRRGVVGAMIRRCGTPASRNTDRLIESLNEQAGLLGQKLLLSFYNVESLARCFDLLTETRHFDGLVFAGRIHHAIGEKLNALKAIPVVILDGIPPSKRISHIGRDNVQVGYVAARHLIDRGCRRIAHIYNDRNHIKGWRRALREASLPMDESLIFRAANHGHVEGVKAVRRLLRAGVDFDGIAAQSDTQAAGAINELTQRNIDVPGRVKVIGVDNSPFCDFFPCPISSVDLNLPEIGRQGMLTLVRHIDAPAEKAVHINVEPSVIQRKSTE